MTRPDISKMTLRQKIGQTGMPGPNHVYRGIRDCGGYNKYFMKYPFAGLYLTANMKDHNERVIPSPKELAGILQEASDTCEIPLFVSCDAEFGAKGLFDELHSISTNMSMGAAGSGELAYQRSYYYARELRTCGVNWAFSPVCDMVSNFFDTSGVRCMSDQPDIIMELLPDIIRGFQDAGVGATAKHFPGSKGDYRDAHFSTATNNMTREAWDTSYGRIWKAAVDADVDAVMVSHSAFPMVDPSRVRGKTYRPATASKKTLDILREEMGYQGVILTDAVSMKGVTSAFEHEDIYIECFNAGNDMILFCHNDYIDVMEKAVLDGRVSMQRLDEAVERILNMKEKLGLFEGRRDLRPLTNEENQIFEQVSYDIGKKAITLINNEDRMIPFDPVKVKRVSIINLAPFKPFQEELEVMVQAFQERGVEVNLLECLRNKAELERISKTDDIIIYACYLAQSRPQGMSFFSAPEDILTLYHGLSYGAEKSVVVSFGAPSIYYNYFEAAGAYLNAYSSDAGTMKAFVDGILGEYAFSGNSPVALKPEFAD